jgi:hypothetical protein
VTRSIKKTLAAATLAGTVVAGGLVAGAGNATAATKMSGRYCAGLYLLRDDAWSNYEASTTEEDQLYWSYVAFTAEAHIATYC